MTEPTPTQPAHPSSCEDDREVDLLDLLAVAAENARLLIVGPLLVGVLALGVAFVWPKTYESVSVVSVAAADQISPAEIQINPAVIASRQINPAAIAAWVSSADLLLPVIEKLGNLGALPKDQALQQAREMIKVTVGKQDKLITLTSAGHTPEAAQRLNQMVLDQVYVFSKPKGPQKDALLFQLDIEKSSLAAAVVLEKDVASRLSADKMVTEAKSRELLDLLRSKTALAASVAKLQLQLEGLSAADLVQSPTLPERHAQPKKPMVAIAASLLSGVLLVVFVGLRQTLRNAKANPISAAKLQRIRRAFSGRG